MKGFAKPLTALTAYDFNSARAIAESGIDIVLVGDSLAMVALGYTDTTQVSMEEMLICTKAVVRGVKYGASGAADTHRASDAHTINDTHRKISIVADLPYCAISEDKIDNIIIHAEKFITAGANAIKIENARPQTLELIQRLTSRGIEVMGHIGYTPQDIELFRESKIIRDADALMNDALAIVDAGVSSMVLEMVPASIAREITEAVPVPTIGIGSGAHTNGQILVTDDLLGRYNLMKPKFLRRYAEQYDEMLTAISSYAKDVRSGDFPRIAESYN